MSAWCHWQGWQYLPALSALCSSLCGCVPGIRETGDNCARGNVVVTSEATWWLEEWAITMETADAQVQGDILISLKISKVLKARDWCFKFSTAPFTKLPHHVRTSGSTKNLWFNPWFNPCQRCWSKYIDGNLENSSGYQSRLWSQNKTVLDILSDRPMGWHGEFTI